MNATHVYVGPTTRWGLNHGARCRIIGYRGAPRIQTDAGNFLVATSAHLMPIVPSKRGRRLLRWLRR